MHSLKPLFEVDGGHADFNRDVVSGKILLRFILYLKFVKEDASESVLVATRLQRVLVGFKQSLHILLLVVLF